ncbi:MAG: hypothetical protein JKY37_20440 [Nannocystaceae bacterium]|nr:hypothetical protein [Nannocystaceae bacterium]
MSKPDWGSMSLARHVEPAFDEWSVVGPKHAICGMQRDQCGCITEGPCLVGVALGRQQRAAFHLDRDERCTMREFFRVLVLGLHRHSRRKHECDLTVDEHRSTAAVDKRSAGSVGQQKIPLAVLALGGECVADDPVHDCQVGFGLLRISKRVVGQRQHEEGSRHEVPFGIRLALDRRELETVSPPTSRQRRLHLIRKYGVVGADRIKDE